MTIQPVKTSKVKNNKTIGSEFEKDFCDYLSKMGFWVHFLNPAPNGSQPFDIIAISRDTVLCIDCKTLEGDRFPFNRIEDNQESAFSMLNNKGFWTTYFCIKISDTEIVMAPSYELIKLSHSELKSISVRKLVDLYGTHNFK